MLFFLLQAATQDLPPESRDDFGLFPQNAYTAEGVESYYQYWTVPNTTTSNSFRIKGNLAEWGARLDVIDFAFWRKISEKNMLGKGHACFPLEIAVTRGNARLVAALIDLGADPKILVHLNLFSHQTMDARAGEMIQFFDSRSEASLLAVAEENRNQVQLGTCPRGESPQDYNEVIRILQAIDQ